MKQDFFIKRYADLGWQFKDIKPQQALRVNTLKISPAKLVERLTKLGISLEKIPFLRHGYAVEKAKFSIGALTEYLLGYYYIQEAASQKTVELLAPQQNEIILDMAAAPGGKTTHAAQLMNNRGVIIALEKKRSRLIALKNHLERMGIANTIAYQMNALSAPRLGLQFDKVLLDAPCSGNFTQERNWFAKRTLEDIKGIAQLQKELLKVAYNALTKTGELVYSTCSLEPEENEENVQWFMENFDVTLVKQERIWPSLLTQGFFMAKFRKKFTK